MIGVNTLYLIPNAVGGTETYLRGFLKGLTHDQRKSILIFANLENANTFPGFKTVVVPVAAKVRPLRILAEQLILPFYLIKHQVTQLISFGYVTPLITHCPKTTVIYDLNWHFQPQDFSFLTRTILKLLVTLSAKFSNKIITSSQTSKERLIKVLKLSPQRITVAYGAVDPTIFRHYPKSSSLLEKYKITSPYIFTVSAAYKFKNLSKLVYAYALLRKKITKPPQLVVAGLKGGGLPDLYQAIKETKLQLGKDLLLLGYVIDKDLPKLYSQASLFVFPSLHEGFGFPVLEAMSSKVAVVSSSAQPLKELVGQAAITTDAKSAPDLSSAMLKGLKPYVAKKLILQGSKQVKKFSWKKTTKTILNALTS